MFDNEMLVQEVAFGFRVGEVSCPTRHSIEASSINFRRSVFHEFGMRGTAINDRLHRLCDRRSRLLEPEGRRLPMVELGQRR